MDQLTPCRPGLCLMNRCHTATTKLPFQVAACGLGMGDGDKCCGDDEACCLVYCLSAVNPDGCEADTRVNANAKDLNRNFPLDPLPFGG